MRHIGDGDPDHMAAGIGRVVIGMGVNRVIMVARIPRVDGDERQLAQILAALETGGFHRIEIGLNFVNRVVEQDRFPRPAAVRFGLEVIERARVARRDLRPGAAHAFECILDVRPDHTRRVVDDHPRARIADRPLHLLRQVRVPRRDMAFIRLLATQVDVHDARALVIGTACLGGHVARRHRHVMLLGIGQYPVQRACNHGLVCHVLDPDYGAASTRP